MKARFSLASLFLAVAITAFSTQVQSQDSQRGSDTSDSSSSDSASDTGASRD